MNGEKRLKRKGINYDVGTHTRGQGSSSRDEFDPRIVRREMELIRRELHCNAIRISGQDISRLELAAQEALRQGMEVWLSPSFVDADARQTLDYLAKCAQAAERIRRQSPNIVFVVGCELTFFMKGMIAGATAFDRMRTMMSPWRLLASTIRRGSFHRRLNRFLGDAVQRVRAIFQGPVTYASGPWENVDWSGFDFVSVDYYRDARNRKTYREGLRAYFRHGKPVVVTEFGCCTYRGAADKGGYGWAVVDRSQSPYRLNGDFARDEEGQARHLTEMLQIYREEGVDGAFWFTFVMPTYPHREEARFDLDMASYGVVKACDDRRRAADGELPWEPKLAYIAMSNNYEER